MRSSLVGQNLFCAFWQNNFVNILIPPSGVKLCGKEVIKFRLCIQVFLKAESPFVFDQVAYLAGWIEQVTEFPCPRWTSLHAGRITSLPYSLDTKGAFFHNIFHSGPVAQIVNLGI